MSKVEPQLGQVGARMPPSDPRASKMVTADAQVGHDRMSDQTMYSDRASPPQDGQDTACRGTTWTGARTLMQRSHGMS